MDTDRSPLRRLAFAALALLAAGCGSSPAQPTPNALSITAIVPASGATVIIPSQYTYYPLGGTPLPPGNGLLGVSVKMSVGANVPWAELNVYMLTGGTTDQYCGQNTPDSPTWQFLTPGWSTSYTVTGFRVYRVPCDVTGFRAMLHMRNNGSLMPPSPSETIAEATVPVSFRIQY